MCPPHVEERCLCEPFDLVAIKQTEQSVWLEQVDTGVVVGAPAVASVLSNALVLAKRVHRRYHGRTRQRKLTDSATRCRLRWKRDGKLGALVELKGDVEGVGPAKELAVQERIRGKPAERQRRRVGGGLPLRHRASDDETPDFGQRLWHVDAFDGCNVAERLFDERGWAVEELADTVHTRERLGLQMLEYLHEELCRERTQRHLCCGRRCKFANEALTEKKTR